MLNFKTEFISMIKHLADTVPAFILGGISLATIGTVISIASGLMALFYTGLKIYEWFENRRKSKHANKNKP
jgi:hypothetical protein